MNQWNASFFLWELIWILWERARLGDAAPRGDAGREGAWAGAYPKILLQARICIFNKEEQSQSLMEKDRTS